MSLRSGVCRTKTKHALKLRIAEQKLTICTKNLEDAMGCYYVNANRGRASTLYFCSFFKKITSAPWGGHNVNRMLCRESCWINALNTSEPY